MDLKKTLGRLRNLSSKIEKQLEESKAKDLSLANLSEEELHDLGKLVKIADYLVCKCGEKEELKEVIKDLNSTILQAYESLQVMDDDVSEMIYSAESCVVGIRDFQKQFHDESDLRAKKDHVTFQKSPKNLTKIAEEVHTVEYQPKSEGKSVQVI